MRILCLVKFVPDMKRYEHNVERDKNSLQRDQVKMLINPDDAKALGYALNLKEIDHNIKIEVVSMGPESITNKLKDLLRLGVDKGTLISDKLYRGSDSYVTSTILGKYLSTQDYDLILSGSNAIDGSTGHVGPQVAEYLDVEQMSNVLDICKINDDCIDVKTVVGNNEVTLKLSLPCVISFSKESHYKLRYVRYEDLNLNVDHKFFVVNNEMLGMATDSVGLNGSPTKVKKIYKRQISDKKKIIIKADDQGIETVIGYLREKGIL